MPGHAFCSRMGTVKRTYLHIKRMDVQKARELFPDFSGTPEALRARVKRALAAGKILLLKKGLYVHSFGYLHEPNKAKFSELMASYLCVPSYLSLEYMLEQYGLFDSRNDGSITSVSLSECRMFENFDGKFTYRNVKKSLFFGFEKCVFRGQTYHRALKAKALFDYFYLNPEFGRRNQKYLKKQIFELSGLQWGNFSEADFRQFEEYVWKSNSKKMMRIRRAMEGKFEGRKFEQFRKELLGK